MIKKYSNAWWRLKLNSQAKETICLSTEKVIIQPTHNTSNPSYVLYICGNYLKNSPVSYYSIVFSTVNSSKRFLGKVENRKKDTELSIELQALISAIELATKGSSSIVFCHNAFLPPLCADKNAVWKYETDEKALENLRKSHRFDCRFLPITQSDYMREAYQIAHTLKGYDFNNLNGYGWDSGRAQLEEYNFLGGL